MNAEQHFNLLRKRINEATSVNKMLDIMTERCEDNAESYRKYLRKTINKKFKGKIELTRLYFIREINTGEHYYWEAQIEESYN